LFAELKAGDVVGRGTVELHGFAHEVGAEVALFLQPIREDEPGGVILRPGTVGEQVREGWRGHHGILVIETADMLTAVL
jgi:hypothetical protein